jgi:beta-lactamase class A
MSEQAFKKIFSVLMLLGLGFCSGWLANAWQENHFHPLDKRVQRSGFRYISPLLDVELPEGYSVRNEPIPFKHKVKQFVDQQTKTGKVREMSVYYRDMTDGPWFGINEKVKYNPASMMKVPVMVAWLKRAQKDPSVLRLKLTFDKNSKSGPPQEIKPEQTLKLGVSYTVEELLRFMMHFSDNKSTALLYYALAQGEMDKVIASMDAANETDGVNNSITVKGYSGFFRILYNASYLNDEMSEKALQLMSYPSFPEGIVGGVPKGVIVASKFGVFNEDETPDDIQLHEFGIVYHPKGPYILGVLTRGNNWKAQAEIIRSLSELVYDSADKTMPKE